MEKNYKSAVHRFLLISNQLFMANMDAVETVLAECFHPHFWK